MYCKASRVPHDVHFGPSHHSQIDQTHFQSLPLGIQQGYGQKKDPASGGAEAHTTMRERGLGFIDLKIHT